MRNSPLRSAMSSVRSPGAHAADGSLSVDDLLITSELRTRRKRRRQERATRSALQELSRRIGDDPSDVLRRFVELAMQLCGDSSAGISVYEPQSESAGIFRWHTLTGKAARHNGETTPREHQFDAEDARLNDIEAAVHQSHQTEAWEPLAIGVANDFHSIEVAKAVALVNSLRLRERQVLEGLMAGGSTKQIASELGLSVRTVEVHRSHMLHHLGVRRVAMAVRLGVLAARSVHGVIARPGDAHSPPL